MADPATLKVVEQAAKELGLSQLVPAVYQDVLQPAARVAGEKLVVVAKAVSIALAPLEVGVWGYEQIKHYLAATVAVRLAETPPEDIKPAPLIIAGPVVMGMAFAADEPHLKELYANLLAAAMNAPLADRAHPSFVQIIQQLSPREAKILKVIADKFSTSAVLFAEVLAKMQPDVEPRSLAGFWLARDERTPPVSLLWRELCSGCEVKDAALAEAFYRNFLRLGILAERIEREKPRHSFPQRNQPPTKLLTKVELTEYGNLFLNACVRDPGAGRPKQEPSGQ